MLRRILRILAITLFSLLCLGTIIITLAINLYLTPERLTPMANEIAHKFVKSDISIGRVELAFLSTFPSLSVKIDSVSIKHEVDSIPDFLRVRKCVAAIKPLALIRKDISVSQILVEKPDLHIYGDTISSSFDLFIMEPAPADTVKSEGVDLSGYTITIDEVRVDSASLVLNDLVAHARSEFSGLSIDLKANLSKRASDLDLFFGWESLKIDSSQGSFIDGMSFSFDAEVAHNRDSMKFTIPKADIVINGIALKSSGTVRREISKRNSKLSRFAIDFNSELRTASLSEFFDLVPNTILDRTIPLETKGTTELDMRVKGYFSHRSKPSLTAALRVKDGSVMYQSKDMSLDDIDCEADMLLDFNEPENSYANITKFKVATKNVVDLDVNGKIDNIIDDPYVDININSDMNFSRLTEIFPLQDGVVFKGRNSSDLTARFSMSDIQKSNYGRMYIDGISTFRDIDISIDGDKLSQDSVKNNTFFYVKMTKGDMLFGRRVEGKADSVSLASSINLSGLGFRDKDGIYAKVNNVLLYAGAAFDRSKTKVSGLSTKLSMREVNCGVEEELGLALESSDVLMEIIPETEDRKATINTTITSQAITANEQFNGTDLALSAVKMKVDLERQAVKVWNLKGDVGFSDLKLLSKLFPLDIHAEESNIEFQNGIFRLTGAKIKVGDSEMIATGYIRNLLKTLFTNERLGIEGKLSISAPVLYADQLVEATNQSILLIAEQDAAAASAVDSAYVAAAITPDTVLAMNTAPALNSSTDGAAPIEILEDSSASPKRVNPAIELSSNKVALPSNVSRPNLNNFGSDTTLVAFNKDSINSFAAPSVPAGNMILVPRKVKFDLDLDIDKLHFYDLEVENVKGEADINHGVLTMSNLSMESLGAKAQGSVVYKNYSRTRSGAYMTLSLEDVDIKKIGNFVPSFIEMMPMLESFEGIVNFDMNAVSEVDSDMYLDINTLRSAISMDGKDLVLLDSETFAQTAKMLMFKNKKRNLIDSMSMNVIVDKSKIDVLPFEVTMDRYVAIVGGSQTIKDSEEFDIDFKYNVSIMKSPLPFKAGVDIFGDLNDYDFKITKAKLKKTDFNLNNDNFEVFRDSLKFQMKDVNISPGLN